MTTRKEIDVRNQVTLSFEKSFRFCRKGISYRLFRSLLTLAVVVVAVAFFTVLLGEGVLVRSTAAGVSRQMMAERESDALLMHLFGRDSSRDLSVKLAALEGQSAILDEFARVSGLTAKQVADLVKACRVEQAFLNFFQKLSPGKRVVLVKKNTGRDVFEYLSQPAAWDEFTASLARMRSVRTPEDIGTLRAFLAGRAAFMQMLDTAIASRNRTVGAMEEKLKALTGESGLAEWVAAASDAQVEQWRGIVTASGFDLDSAKMDRVREQLRVSALETKIGTFLQLQESRSAWKQVMQTTPGLEEKLIMLADRRVDPILGDRFTIAERTAVADRFVRLRYLRDLLGKLPVLAEGASSGGVVLDGRQMFLILISFLVCMVGITNAMLMSITERFREIATMKCLGATDGFILKQFLIEAAIQGLTGGIAGMLIGLVIAVLKSAVLYGPSVFVYFPGLQIVACALFTVVVGVILAMLASVYPSKAAARMAPMDAMRVE